MKKSLFLLLIISLMLFIGLVFAVSPLETSVSPTSAENGTETLWNITITNNGNAGVNFTQVNITAPSNVTVDVLSNGTSAKGDTKLDINTNTLSWTNNTYLVLNDSTEYFWINATGTFPGDYNVTISTLDTNSKTNSTNLTVTITSDTTNPSINYKSPTPENDAEISQDYIPVNLTATDSSGIDTITIYLYNSTGLESSQTSSSSPFFNNFTGLTDEETYKINATANDTLGNEASLNTRTITINLSASTNDTTAPIITVLSPENKTYTTNTIYFNATANEDISEWKVNYDGTNQTLSSINTTLSVQDGEYHLLLYAKDSAGNWGLNDDIYFTVNAGPETIGEENENETQEGTEAEPVEGGATGEGGSTLLFIIIVVLVIAAIAGVIFALIHFKKKSKSQDSELEQGTQGPSQSPPPGSGGTGQGRAYKPQPRSRQQKPQQPKRHMPPRMQQQSQRRPQKPQRR